LAALGNRTRLRIFKLLVRAGREGTNIGTLQRHLGIPATTLRASSRDTDAAG
jgi:DNA-binding transcriptional ArsR family regulator